jgi:hypothetical protein
LEIWNVGLNSIEKKNCGTSSIQLNILILQLTVQGDLRKTHRKIHPVTVGLSGGFLHIFQKLGEDFSARFYILNCMSALKRFLRRIGF